MIDTAGTIVAAAAALERVAFGDQVFPVIHQGPDGHPMILLFPGQLGCVDEAVQGRETAVEDEDDEWTDCSEGEEYSSEDMRVDGDEEIRGERNYLFDIVKIDLVEYEKFLNSIDQELDHDSDDILSVGFWNKDNTYSEPDHDWRKNMFSPEDDEDDEDDEAPTMLCQDEEKHDAVKDIIAKLKEIEVDGETMEYILDQVGMLDQVAKQLGLVNF
jgi:hypothetical protein